MSPQNRAVVERLFNIFFHRVWGSLRDGPFRAGIILRLDRSEHLHNIHWVPNGPREELGGQSFAYDIQYRSLHVRAI